MKSSSLNVWIVARVGKFEVSCQKWETRFSHDLKVVAKT